MEYGPFFRLVDRLAAEHRIDAFAQTAFLGQSDQQPYGFVGDPVFGIVQVNARGFSGQALAAARIVGEELPQMQITDCGVMGLECLPGRALGQGSARRVLFFQRIALHVPAP